MRIGPPQIGKNRVENNWNLFLQVIFRNLGAPCVKLPITENNRF